MTRAEEFEELRPLLFSIAYRILGSVSEAEDAVQESWLRYQDDLGWHGAWPLNAQVATLPAGIMSPSAWPAGRSWTNWSSLA